MLGREVSFRAPTAKAPAQRPRPWSWPFSQGLGVSVTPTLEGAGTEPGSERWHLCPVCRLAAQPTSCLTRGPECGALVVHE